MWTPEHRLAADRSGLRYPRDLTDAEWVLVEPMIPPGRHGGRRRSVNVRGVLNGIFYILWTGCQWKALPKDLPPKSTVHDYLKLWNWDGTLERTHHALYVAVREQEGREASPTGASIDSQTAKGTQKGGLGSILRATTRARRSKVASGTSWFMAGVISSAARTAERLASATKCKLDILVALQDFFGCDDDSGTPMDAARGRPPSAINGDDAAGDAFDKLRGVVRECEKGAAGFDHDHFSKEKLPARRYDIDTNFLLLAEWLVPNFPRAAGASP